MKKNEKKILKSIICIFIGLLIVFLFQQFKNYQLKKLIRTDIVSEIGKIYDISPDIKRVVCPGNINSDTQKELNGYKLVYEMNFDCSICLGDLKKINDFVLKLNNIREISLLIISTEKSISYVEYRIDQSLIDYDLWVVQQEHKKNDLGLYLLDDTNKIIMAGNIVRYPFLKNEYIKKLAHPTLVQN